MADGHLGKCKECAKADVTKRYYDPVARLRIVAYERARFKDPKRKAKILTYTRSRRSRVPEKCQAYRELRAALRKGILERLPCQVCGEKKSQAHHTDYSKPLDVLWLCFRHHREAHGQKVNV